MKFNVEAITLPEPLLMERGCQSMLVDRPACPICGLVQSGTIARTVGRDGVGLEVRYCADCEHLYLGRRPAAAWYRQYYHTVSARQDRETWRDRVARLPLIRSLARRRFLRQYDRTSIVSAMLRGVATGGTFYRPNPDVRRVLELGCGLGNNLELFRSMGLEVWGQEVSQDRAAISRRKGFPVFECAFVGGESFDMVASSHVLEHVLDLDEHMGMIKSLVRPDGYLYLEVPGIRSEHVFHRAHSPVHVHVFSLRSLTELLARFGFGVVRWSQDHDTHVLAVKSQAAVMAAQDYRQTADLHTFWRGLKGREIRIRYAQHRWITTEQGVEVYRDDGPLETAPGVRWIEAALRQTDTQDGWPVEFCHDGDVPIFR